MYCFAECHYAGRRYAECRYAECHYAESRGTPGITNKYQTSLKNLPGFKLSLSIRSISDEEKGL
jgi:hypothetical protein